MMSRYYVFAGILALLLAPPAAATVYETNSTYPDIQITLTVSGFACVAEDVLDSLGAGGGWNDEEDTDPDLRGPGSDNGLAGGRFQGDSPSDGSAGGSPLWLNPQAATSGSNDPLDSWFTISLMGNAGGGSCVFYPNPLSFPLTGSSLAGMRPTSVTSFDQTTILFHFHISYYLASSGRVTLAIYDMERQRVRTLMSGPQETGWHHLIWDGTNAAGRKVPPGLYVCHLVNHQATAGRAAP
jgi:hypothetical protein